MPRGGRPDLAGAETLRRVKSPTLLIVGGDEDLISVILGGGSTERVTHNINGPTHVRIEQSEEGADMTLQIESDGGVATLVRFRSAILPEMVDGIVSE